MRYATAGARRECSTGKASRSMTVTRQRRRGSTVSRCSIVKRASPRQVSASRTGYRSGLVNEQNVSVGAPPELLVDPVPEQPVEQTVVRTADDDELRVTVVRDLEQPVGRMTCLGDVVRLHASRRQHAAGLLEQQPRLVRLLLSGWS